MKKSAVLIILGLLYFTSTLGWGQTPGWSTVKMGDEVIEIFRDEYGVPHVYAKSFKGIYFGQGYVCAQDRLFQLEMYRRDAKGTMAEIRGESALRHDENRRRRGYSEAERWEIFANIDEETRTALVGLRDGINQYMREAIEADKLPVKFKELGITPEPWSATDSLAISEMMASRFGSGGTDEFRFKGVLDQLVETYGETEGWEMFEDLVPLNDHDAPTTAPKEDVSEQFFHFNPFNSGNTWKVGRMEGMEGTEEKRGAQMLVKADHSVLEEMIDDWGSTQAFAEELGLYTKWGSNAWVVAPKRSASGNAMLFGGPMMGFSTPQIAYEVHLNGPAYLDGNGSMNVIGMAFAGVPTVLIGHNDTMAWTTTSGGGNVSDTYIEKLHPDDQYRYLFNGEWLDMQKRTEIIKVRQSDGSLKEVKYDVYRTVHGPVIGWDLDNRLAFTVKHPWWRDYSYNIGKAFLEFNRARSVKDFEYGCSLIQSTHNFFYADQKGDIAYYWVGKYPIRAPGLDERLPSLGTGENEWRGFVPFKDHPQSVNPAQGYFGNWNNKPADDWPGLYGKIFWGHRILERLAQDDSITLQEMESIAKGTGTDDFIADYLKPYLKIAVQHQSVKDNPLLQKTLTEAMKYIQNYNHILGEGNPAETIYETWLNLLIQEVFADDLGFLFKDKKMDETTMLVLANLLLRVFEPETASVKPSRDYLNGEPRDVVLARALQKTLLMLELQKGADVSKWGQKFRALDFGDAGSIPARRGKYVSVSGTYMQVVELSKPVINGRNVLPPGQSENPNSPHYNDQLELYKNWQYKPMRYRREDLK